MEAVNCMAYNSGHNILELYNTLIQIQFSTNKAKLNNSGIKIQKTHKRFLSCPSLLDFSILFQIFCPELSDNTHFLS